MRISEEQITRIDRNEARARAILHTLTNTNDPADWEGLDVMALLEAAVDYLDQNNEIFSKGL